MRDRWQRYVLEALSQGKIWLFAVCYLGCFRVFLILYYYNKVGESATASDFLAAVMHGFRFDAAVAGLLILVPFAANAAFAPLRLHAVPEFMGRIFAYLFAIVSSLLFVVTVPYFAEYDDQLNHFMFEVLFDDRTAIAKTIWQQYHPLLCLLVFSILAFASVFTVKIVVKKHYTHTAAFLGNLQGLVPRLGLIILMTVLLAGASRGSFRTRPAMRKWASATRDTFLNKTILNPYRSFHYAVKDFRALTSHQLGLDAYPLSGSIREAAARYFDGKSSDDLRDYLRRRTSGPSIESPSHIFLVIMESCDSWPLMEEYRSLGVVENVKKLARNGIHFAAFLPAADLTFNSMASILTGLPYGGLNVNRRRASRESFVSSLPTTFQRLGYKVSFYYGGFLSWQNVAGFLQGQGIERLHGAPHVTSRPKGGVWGVNDEELFDFVLRNTKREEKTLDIILTTSYHGPFTIDVKRNGFLLKHIPDELAGLSDGALDLNVLGHLWYSDKALGEFVAKAEARFPGSLFALTGDHFSRRFLNGRPGVYERSSVPFILYGPQFIKARPAPDRTPGSHIDIMPTLVELIAPANFEYYSFGRSLLEGHPEAADRAAFGRTKAITGQVVVEFHPQIALAPVPGSVVTQTNVSIDALRTKHDQLHALGWWLTMKGYLLAQER